MKYPVTPTRADIIGKNRVHCLSLLSDDDEQDVYIWHRSGCAPILRRDFSTIPIRLNAQRNFNYF